MGSEKYITIYDWMLQLGLTSSELLAFALVYRYTSHGQKLTASSETYAKWLGLHPNNARLVMDKLAKKGLVMKYTTFNGSARYCEYAASFIFSHHFASNKTLLANNETLPATNNKTLQVASNETLQKNKNEEKDIRNKVYFSNAELFDMAHGKN